MPLSTQTQELFTKVFGRPAESPEETSFLKDAAGRKSGGALEGALQWHKQQGRFGGGQPTGQPGGQPSAGPSQGELDSSESLVTGFESAFKMMNKKAQKLDQLQKKLFTEDLKQKVRSEILSMPEIKALQKKKGELAGRYQTESFGPSDSALLDPGFVDKLALDERGDFAQSLSDVTESIRTRESGVGDFIDRISGMRDQELAAGEKEFGRAKDIFNSSLDVNQEVRAGQEFELNQKVKLSEIALNEAKALAEKNGAGANVVPGDKSTLSQEARMVLDNPALFSESGFLTPTKKQEILAELGRYGIDKNQLASLTYESIPDAARSQIAQFDGVTRMAQGAFDALDKGTFGTGPVQSRKNSIATTLGIPPAGWTDYAALVSASSAAELRRQSGVAVTPSEFDRLKPYLPQVGDQEGVAKDKIRLFIAETQKLQAERVKAAISNPNDFAKTYLGKDDQQVTDEVNALRNKYNY